MSAIDYSSFPALGPQHYRSYPAQAPSHSSFNFKKAYGDNPFSGPAAMLSRAIEPLYGQAARLGNVSAESLVARPDDPEVGEYMSHLLAGQRNVMDDYVRRAAGAGIRRGGLNVVGGPPQESSLHHQAMRSLANDYTNRFGEAMNYNKYAKRARYNQLSDSVRHLENLLGLQKSYLSDQAGWQRSMGASMQQAWNDDSDWARQTPARNLGYAGQAQQLARAGIRSQASPSPQSGADPMQQMEIGRMRQELDMQRKRNMWEQQDRQRAIDQRNRQLTSWLQLRMLPPVSDSATNATGASLSSHLALSKAASGTSSRSKAAGRLTTPSY